MTKKQAPKVLFKTVNLDLDKVLELVKTDRFKTRVLIKNDPSKYTYTEIIVFEDKNQITVIDQTKKLNISINNRLYYTIQHKQVYLYKNNKFWYLYNSSRNKTVRPLSINNFPFLSISEDSLNQPGTVLKFFIEKFSWIRFLLENSSVFSLVPFNTIIKHKLYNYNDLLKHLYKSNLPTAKFMVLNGIDAKRYKTLLKYTTNLNETSNKVIINSSSYLFNDTINMAIILNKKVNCAWSVKRLQQEHDNWAKEITNIVMEETNRELKIKEEYIKFAQQNPDFKLIDTTKELAIEGLTQSHCVATYSNNVDNGDCAIFHINGYTAEIKLNNNELELGQFAGYKNQKPPEELKTTLENRIYDFNKNLRNIDNTIFIPF
jgi:hypothetical protein